jgi:lipoyl(octanoyl) transferase
MAHDVPVLTSGPTASLAPPGRRATVRELGCVPYAQALALQDALAAETAAGERGDALLLLEHPPVYTLGRGADAADLRGAPERLGVPVYRVGRGGGATFHGPGQMVAYPIVRLRAGGRDVHGYVRCLEAALIATCSRFGIAAEAPPAQTGVWAGGRKLASIGIGVRRGVAYHGVALNVSTDLSYFAHIVPCRTSGLAVVNLAELLGWHPTVQEVGRVFAACLADHMGFAGLEWDREP